VAIGLYVKAVEDLPFEKTSSAMSELIRTKKFFPSPADIRELVTGSEPAIEDKAIIECAKVAVAVRNHGHYRAVVFDDPVTMAVIRQIFGGWWRLCRGLSDHDAK